MARSTSARPTASPYSESCPDDRFNQKMARSSPPQFPVGGDFTSPSFFLAFDTSEASVKKKRRAVRPSLPIICPAIHACRAACVQLRLLLRLQILQQVVHEIIDLTLRQGERIASHRLLTDRLIH